MGSKVNAADLLTAAELNVAILSRAGMGPNAVAGSMGLSTNTVKTLLRRIKRKLGSGWMHNKGIAWDREPAATGEESSTAGPGGTVYAPPEPVFPNNTKELLRQRGLGFRLLVLQNRSPKVVLRVSGAQRFWLRPALTELQSRKYLRLIVADRYDVFDPPWLPILNRGRKAIRAASFITIDYRHVQEHLERYLATGLPALFKEYVEFLESLQDRVRPFEAELPTQEDLENSLAEAFLRL